MAGLAVAAGLFKPFFGDIEGFMDSFKTSDVASAANPEMGAAFEESLCHFLRWACGSALVGGTAYGVWYGLGKLFS